jgi:uroporphyrinogen-III synthase
MARSKKSDLPFAGVRVLVGRAEGQAELLASLLSEFGARVTAIPFIAIRPPKSWADLDHALKGLTSYQWLILTSANGVRALFSRMDHLGISAQHLFALEIAVIGPATKAALEERGVQVSITPAEYVAEAVVEALRSRVGGKKVLLVRAQEARDVIPRELKKAGAEVDVVAAYETVLPPGSKTRLKKLLLHPQQRPHVVAFTSSSTVRNFMKLASGMPLDGIRFVSIGPVTSSTLREVGLTPHAQAREYTMEGLAKAIADLSF